MSKKSIPTHIDPFRFAELSLNVEGSLCIADMTRLGVNVVPDDSIVTVNLQFGLDDQGITYLIGNLKTALTLLCQRCMKPFTYEIISKFELGIVKTLDEANALSANYEPAIAKEGMLALKELIEDEIILNLPLVPRHDPES